ncbi:putative type II secretion system protein E [Neorhodopirellula pilleata]|uniref:Putative type II secretion system protein E n=2 Tax=Neorhodopirellula pilleata TaxID=2714738 RepID=A0A5C6AQR8_9BACT|nr:putative type II secretion system protein E [Neorhodopirellula pilleata]
MAARLMAASDEDFDLEMLGLTTSHRDDIQEWLVRRDGILVVAGPTGSGKTTLLYTLAKMLDTPEQSIVTLEDPVEKRFATMTQIEIDSENGLKFADAMVASLRLDPDYLLIGETRDEATANASVAAANSGRTLLTSMHCNDAVGVVTNYRFWDVSDLEIATSLRFVISSRLVRKLCDHCKTEKPLDSSDAAWLENREINLSKSMGSVGCSHCHHTGYRGRIGIHDLWRINAETSKAIRAGIDVSELRPSGNRTLLQQGIDRVREGITTVEELRRAGLS